jgi:hypothetical protein
MENQQEPVLHYKISTNYNKERLLWLAVECVYIVMWQWDNERDKECFNNGWIKLRYFWAHRVEQRESSKGPHRSTSELFKIYEVKPDMQSEDRMVEARQRVVPPALSQWLRGSKSSSVYLEVV